MKQQPEICASSRRSNPLYLLGSLASSNVGSRGTGSEASDDRGRQKRVGAGARVVVFQGDG